MTSVSRCRGLATANLLDMLENGYDGPSAKEMREIVEYALRSSPLLLGGSGEAAAGGRTGEHIWDDSIYAVGFEMMAEIARRQGDLRQAGQFRHVAQLLMQSHARFQQERGWFSITKNLFHPSLKHRYATWSGMANSEGFTLTCLTEALSARKAEAARASGGALEWNGVDGGDGGATTIGFRYALGLDKASTKRAKLFVNGTPQPELVFLSTGAWNDWHQLYVPVTLARGTQNTITIRLEADWKGASAPPPESAVIDELRVHPAKASTPEPDQQSFIALRGMHQLDASSSAVRGGYGDFRPVCDGFQRWSGGDVRLSAGRRRPGRGERARQFRAQRLRAQRRRFCFYAGPRARQPLRGPHHRRRRRPSAWP